MTLAFRLLLVAPLALCSISGENMVDSTAVAEIDGHVISSRELGQAGGVALGRLEDQVYAMKHQKLEELIANRLLAREAAKRSISIEALIEKEVTSKIGAITAEEVHNVYELNKNQLQKPEAEVRVQIENFLRNQKAATRRQEYVKSLQSQAKVITYLEPPVPFRAELSGDGLARGAAEAPVTIVEFEDFQCPFCKRVQATLDQVLLRYKDKVKFVHRDFPLQSIHPLSSTIHEAARCAEEQNKFWEFRDLLYASVPAASGQDQLNNYAAQLKLDVPAFQRCAESGKFKAAVQKDEEEGTRLGVEGTPAFFINGRLLSGAQPESAFVQVIDEELNKRAQR